MGTLCLVVLWFSCILDLLMVNNGKDSMHVCLWCMVLVCTNTSEKRVCVSVSASVVFLVFVLHMLWLVWWLSLHWLCFKIYLLILLNYNAFGAEFLGSQIHNKSMREWILVLNMLFMFLIYHSSLSEKFCMIIIWSNLIWGLNMNQGIFWSGYSMFCCFMIFLHTGFTCENFFMMINNGKDSMHICLWGMVLVCYFIYDL